ncbi:virulence protein RhuM/Fic/DOC family protein [Leucobacter allii]|uniref:Virulence protein RhuM/Fic/DOC family protein n=1 Tax=Leucobacter allii TaxID=2932247 RepID=A0ABY4FMK0_9MICO|nr:virulence protein RhuM/Fic/DOC family protein [Leucobacter allii]UOQ57489.1 virulence protein RhuM/Fic/DOC family protein [Leucobacter allii]
MSSADVVVYSAPGIELALPFDRERETVWASQSQITQLFGISVSSVSRHIRNVLADEEVDAESNLQKVQIASADRPVTLYSLDVILAVGYRANSASAIGFRRWATGVLRRYVLDGVAANARRLEQLGAIVRVLERTSDELVAGVAEVLSAYLPSLRLLRAYDTGVFDVLGSTSPKWVLTLDEARGVIAEVAAEFPADTMFGKERSAGLAGVIGAVYQGFEGNDLYPTVEEKAANLLYLTVKDHPLSDGNKRSAAALFVHFLAKNGALFDVQGAPRISNNALAAITLMVAVSDPKEKPLMVAMVTRMLNEEA